jgi:hypothetical protein
MITTIMLVLWPVTILTYIIYNLYRKNVKIERMLIKQSSFVNMIILTFRELTKTTDQIDARVWSQSDPELEALFNTVKELQEKIKDFLDNE